MSALFVPKDRKSLFRQFLAGMYDAVVITDPNEENAAEEDWSNLMVDFDDAQNAKSDKEMTNDEIEKMKHDSDMQEAQKLFDEYMKARQENDIDTPMDFDCFRQRRRY